MEIREWIFGLGLRGDACTGVSRCLGSPGCSDCSSGSPHSEKFSASRLRREPSCKKFLGPAHPKPLLSVAHHLTHNPNTHSIGYADNKG